MSAARRKRKRLLRCLASVLAGAAVLPALSLPAFAGLTQRIVVDWHSGLAIAGYDPVAFFADGKPMAGSGKLELRLGGVVWRFCNVGNRAAFAERPDIYMPQYGGYDPVAVARGVAVAGNPQVWAIVGQRLFLFYDVPQREKFLADSAFFIAASRRKWPRVMDALDP
jgi:hypothetical protein